MKKGSWCLLKSTTLKEEFAVAINAAIAPTIGRMLKKFPMASQGTAAQTKGAEQEIKPVLVQFL